jgi:hypothetical protein
MVLGWLVAMYSGIRILIIAFNESALQGILYMMFWPYQLFYIITRWDKCGGYFLMNLGAVVVMCVGFGALILAEILENPEGEGSLHRRPAIQVVAIERPWAKVQVL